MMAEISRAEMARARYVLSQVRDEWLMRPGVTAVDMGYEWREGQMTGRLAIRVHVAQKKLLAEVVPAERFPEEVAGFPVDVIEATYGLQRTLEAQDVSAAVAGRGDYYDPIPLGVSIGNEYVTAGTLGARVLDTTTGEEMILSNWHVLAGSEAAKVGLAIWQPGRADGGSVNDAIGELVRWQLGPYDAAVARLTGARIVETMTVDGEAIEDVTAPRLGMKVWKSGRSTGRTEGLIDGLSMTVPLTYPNGGTHLLQDAMHIVPRPGSSQREISQGGDSGAVWVDEASGKAVGLHFAGEVGSQPEYALAHDLAAVLRALGARLPAEKAAEPPQPPAAGESSGFWTVMLAWLKQLLGIERS